MAKILLIDESPWIMIHMKKVLELSGHEIFCSSDGQRGMTLIEEKMPDLILTDVIIPGKDGFEIISEIKKKFPGMKIIAMSSKLVPYADQYLNAMRSFGVELTIKKPFRDLYLLNAVNSVLETQKSI